MHQPQPQAAQFPDPQPLIQRQHRGGLAGALAVLRCVGVAVVGMAGVVVLIDPRCHHVGLPAPLDLLADPLPGAVQPGPLDLGEDDLGGDGLAPLGQLAQRRDGQVAVHRQRDGPRDRGGGHHQQVRADPAGGLGAQGISLFDAEPVLLVDDDHPELGELHRVLQQRVSADHDAGLPGRNLLAHLAFLRRGHRAGQQRHPGGVLGAAELAGHRQWPQHVAHRPGVLFGQHLGRREQRALIARIDELRHP